MSESVQWVTNLSGDYIGKRATKSKVGCFELFSTRLWNLWWVYCEPLSKKKKKKKGWYRLTFLVLKSSMYYLKKKARNPWTVEQSGHCRHLHARREKKIFTGIVTGDIVVNFPIHCDVEALAKSIYKSETENHQSCERTICSRSQYVAPEAGLCFLLGGI